MSVSVTSGVERKKPLFVIHRACFIRHLKARITQTRCHAVSLQDTQLNKTHLEVAHMKHNNLFWVEYE